MRYIQQNGILVPQTSRNRQRGFITCGPAFFGAPASSGGDPYWSYVTSLLYFDETSGSSFIDQTGLAWTANGSVTATADANTPTGHSAYFNGGVLTAAGSPNFEFGSGLWTIEFFVRATSPAANTIIIDRRATSSSSTPYTMQWASTARSVTVGTQAVAGSWDALGSSSVGIASNTRTHVALVRDDLSPSSNVSMYFGGVASLHLLMLGSPFTSSALACLGANADKSQSTVMYMDQFRVTKGIARYTANFTPPTGIFPNHA